MPWHIILILLVGGLIGYGVRRRRPLLVGLLAVAVVAVVAGSRGGGWLIVAIVILVPLLVAALAGATLRQWYVRLKGGSPNPAPPTEDPNT